MLKKLIYLLGLGVVCLHGSAQDTADINVKKTVIDSAVSLYYQYTDRQSRLYNGVEFLGYSPRIEGHAFFLTNDWVTGSLVYDGMEYRDVPLMYDIFKDGLILRHFNSYFRVGLVREKIKEFDLGNHHFIRLEIDSLAKSAVSTGFYEVLYNGSVTVLARRIKTISETITYQLEQKFVQQDMYFIYKDSTYYAVKGNNDLLSVLKEKRNELKNYLRKNRYRYRKDPENTIIKAAAYYDSSIK
jgi:hypothetical protein